MHSKWKSFVVAFGLFVGAVLGAQLGFGAGVIPNIPSTPQFSEPSQLIGTFNQFIAMLNGQSSAITPAGATIAVGSFATGTSTGNNGSVTVNAQRGLGTITGVSSLAQGATTPLTLTNSFVNAASMCTAQLQGSTNAGSAPFLATISPLAGSLSLLLANAGSSATGTSTIQIMFNCFN